MKRSNGNGYDSLTFCYIVRFICAYLLTSTRLSGVGKHSDTSVADGSIYVAIGGSVWHSRLFVRSQWTAISEGTCNQLTQQVSLRIQEPPTYTPPKTL